MRDDEFVAVLPTLHSPGPTVRGSHSLGKTADPRSSRASSTGVTIGEESITVATFAAL